MKNKPLQLLGLALLAALAVTGVSCAALAQDPPLTSMTPITTEAPTSVIPTAPLPTETPRPPASITPLAITTPGGAPSATPAVLVVTSAATEVVPMEVTATPQPAAVTAAPGATATALPSELPTTGGELNALLGLLPLLALLLLAIPAVVGWKTGQK